MTIIRVASLISSSLAEPVDPGRRSYDQQPVLSGSHRRRDPFADLIAPPYWCFWQRISRVVASSDVPDQLHARPIFSLISNTPDSTKFVSLFSPGSS